MGDVFAQAGEVDTCLFVVVPMVGKPYTREISNRTLMMSKGYPITFVDDGGIVYKQAYTTEDYRVIIVEEVMFD